MQDFTDNSQSNDEKIGNYSIAVIIVAAGRGHRASTDLPKQYQNILNKTVLNHTITSFISCNGIDNILCVIHPDDHKLYKAAIGQYKLREPVHGGSTRQESVMNGLMALKNINPDIVLIHDAARPFVEASVVAQLIKSIASGEKATLPVLPIVDTIKNSSNGYVSGTTDRKGLYGAQTPQAFNYTDIVTAHTAAIGKEFTDDVAVAEAAGISIKMIEGSESAFKITHKEDFRKAEQHLMMQMSDIRMGSGYDVHKFEDGDHVWLCGVQIPHSHALRGHSDADVAMHALTDALYGAMAAGDIGRHFPPSDPQWKGAPSHIFLKHAADMVTAKGGMIANVDITIICEAPKVGPHAEAMRQKLAEIMGVAVARISVKATTTEKLGFTGRKEGIAADAIATIRLPMDNKHD